MIHKENEFITSNHIEKVSQLDDLEMHEVMSHMPNWLITRGVTVLFFITIFLLVASYFIKYPDQIISDITITSKNPPVKIIAHSNGRLDKLFVKDNQSINRNEEIGLIENPAKYEDVVHLKELLKELNELLKSDQPLEKVNFSNQLRLGDMQGGYAALLQALRQYFFFKRQNFHKRKIEQIETQLAYYEGLIDKLKLKDRRLNSLLSLERKKFIIDSTLYTSKAIAPSEFYDAQSKHILQEINGSDNDINILQNTLLRADLNKNIFELKYEEAKQESDFKNNITEHLEKMEGELSNWNYKYLLRSPIEGKVIFNKFWNEHQIVHAEENVFIVDPGRQQYICRANVAIQGAGKIKRGQRVLIKLAAYPFEEFGIISGEVKSISQVPLDTGYSIEVQLIRGLVTNRKILIPYNSLLEGKAIIITKNKSVLERFFNQVLQVTSSEFRSN